MTPAERVAALERLDGVIRERILWNDLRALGAYEDLWELALGQAQQAANVVAAARAAVEHDEEAVDSAEPSPIQRSLTTLRAYLEDIDVRLLQHESSAMFEALGVIEQHIAAEQDGDGR